MIITLLRIFLACFIAFLITVSLSSLIVLFGSFCYKYFAYGRIKRFYGREQDMIKSSVFNAVYNVNVHISFERLLKFYNVSPEKYEVKHSRNYKGICYLTRIAKQQKYRDFFESAVTEVHFFIMDTFSDFLKYQKFCKSIEKQRERKEQQEKEQKDLQQSDSALGEYVELVKGDIAENERQLNEKIEQLKEELQKQKNMLKEK